MDLQKARGKTIWLDPQKKKKLVQILSDFTSCFLPAPGERRVVWYFLYKHWRFIIFYSDLQRHE
jgi:hypothetical protein